MMSTWITLPPPRSAAATSSPRCAKSADNIEGRSSIILSQQKLNHSYLAEVQSPAGPEAIEPCTLAGPCARPVYHRTTCTRLADCPDFARRFALAARALLAPAIP